MGTRLPGSQAEAMAPAPWFRQDTSDQALATAPRPYPATGTLRRVKRPLTYTVAMLLFAAGLWVTIQTIASWI